MWHIYISVLFSLSVIVIFPFIAPFLLYLKNMVIRSREVGQKINILSSLHSRHNPERGKKRTESSLIVNVKIILIKSTISYII